MPLFLYPQRVCLQNKGKAKFTPPKKPHIFSKMLHFQQHYPYQKLMLGCCDFEWNPAKLRSAGNNSLASLAKPKQAQNMKVRYRVWPIMLISSVSWMPEIKHPKIFPQIHPDCIQGLLVFSKECASGVSLKSRCMRFVAVT